MRSLHSCFVRVCVFFHSIDSRPKIKQGRCYHIVVNEPQAEPDREVYSQMHRVELYRDLPGEGVHLCVHIERESMYVYVYIQFIFFSISNIV